MKNKQAHKLLIIIIGLALLLSIFPSINHAAIPHKINYQGYLTDPQGTVIDATVSMVFSIYSQASGGTALWTETQTVTVTDGVFSTDLGYTNPITLPFDTPYYLGITLGSDSEMTPRQPLTSTGYAFRAKEADRVKDNAVTTTAIANNSVTIDKISDDAISETKIVSGAVGSSAIANGAVGSVQIGDNSINTQDLADDAVTVDKIAPPILSSIDGVTNDGGDVDLVAGPNVIITPDDNANTITIESAGAGGSLWTESGGNVYRDSGNVGIGTTSPQAKLSFGADPFTPRKIALWDEVNNFYGLGIFPGQMTFFTNDTEKMSILDNGNVGIGTSDPNYRFEVNGTTVIGSDSKGIRMRTDGALVDLESLGSALSINHVSGFNTLLNADSGKVGIGTWFPDQKLTIQGESGDYAIVKINQIGDPMWTGLVLNRDGAEKWFIGMSLVSDDLLFRRSASSNDMVIKESGKVGIGTLSPNQKLTVVSTGTSDSPLYPVAAVYGKATGCGSASEGHYNFGGYFEADGKYGSGAYAKGHIGIEAYGTEAGIYATASGASSQGIVASGDTAIIAAGTSTGIRATAIADGEAIFAKAYHLAGHFIGDVVIEGNLSKSGGSFKIDHPLEPENKYLQHSFVESPDMMNVYNGNVLLNEQGEAWVELPDWFEALNRNFRYQLTCIGGFAPVYIAEKITDNHFKIAGGIPQMEVSWQVTGIRDDPYAKAHPIQVEEVKPPEEQGYYLHPDVYGQGEEKSIEWARNPERKQRMKDTREAKSQS